MLNGITVRMCTTTGHGASKNRWFAGVMAAPPVSCVNRATPAIVGTRLNSSSPAGTIQSERLGIIAAGVDWVME
jgi:hypothetical protein